MKHADQKYMNMAVKLAAKGGRAVAPNPMVGAVIVKNGKVIGHGYHQKFGGPHAEVKAVKSVRNRKDLIGAVIYVTLEPCRHHGKTPPCQDLIEKVGITQVVYGSKDPFQKGRRPKGLRHLPSPECETLNKFFFTWVRKSRPYITVKIAVSADGFIAGPEGQPVHLTSTTQDKRVHLLRAQHQAILVGSNTVLLDNPRLTVRYVQGQDPLRVILDSRKRIPSSAHVFKDKNYLHITKPTPLKKLMSELAEKGISSVLVEPGPTLYKTLKKARLIDELIVLKGKRKVKEGLVSPVK